MIDFLGFIYDVAKDIKAYLAWDEEEKLVDINWPAKSGFNARAEAEGMSLRWSKPDKCASRELDGYEVLFEIDQLKRIRRKLVLNDGSILMGKRR